jgi:ribosomal protein S18 acetylase RimI-like enzyme
MQALQESYRGCNQRIEETMYCHALLKGTKSFRFLCCLCHFSSASRRKTQVHQKQVHSTSRRCTTYVFLIVSMLLLIQIADNNDVHGLSLSPPFGLGAVLFQPKGLVTTPARGEIQNLLDASDFFVDAFWVGKVGGGASELSDRQRRQLSSLQFTEFRSRYAGVSRGQAELILCQLPTGELIGCAGIEVSPIPENNLKGPKTQRGPLMSNVAVSKEYRRKGIGEKLVKEAERIARYEWGYDNCYLYVEERNKAAVRLYQKLGYRRMWVDSDARTLLPTNRGNLEDAPTKIVCMRKRLGLGVLSRLWPF